MEGDDDCRDEIRRRALEEAFGESSDDDGAVGGKEEDDDEEDESDPSSSSCSLLLEERDRRPHRWEMIDGVKGLWLCREFLSAAQQSSLLSAIEHEGWFDDGCHNQAMRFGDLPGWATKLSRLVCGAVWFSEVSPAAGTESIVGDQHGEDCWPLPLDLLQREPLFDQLIANVYYPGEGICAHVDLMRFDDGIAIISLESACVMHFTQCKHEDNSHKSQEEEGLGRIPVFLNAGSLVVMSGEARYLWKHEINRKQGFQLWEGRELDQQRRTSVTLRKLCKSHN